MAVWSSLILGWQAFLTAGTNGTFQTCLLSLAMSFSVAIFFLCYLSFSSHFPFLCTPLFILSSFFFLSLSTFLPPLLNFLHLSFTQSSQTTTRKLQIQSFSRAMHSSFKLTNIGLMHTCAHQYMHFILSSGALSAVVIWILTEWLVCLQGFFFFFFGQFAPLGNPFFNHKWVCVRLDEVSL